jgi:hypothetical protein
METLKAAPAAAMLAALFLFLAPAEGSLWRADRWGYGPLAGLNVSGADLGGPEDRGIAGWAIGGRVQLDVNRRLSLAADPMFIRSGAEFDPADESFEARGQFYRLELPMLLKARGALYNVGVYAFAGPSATFLWDASGQLEAGHHLDGGDARWGGVSGDIGLGSSFAVASRIEVTADARYSHAFTDLLDGGVGEVDSWRSRDVRLMLGVLVHGG